jgi:hypothetical protein
MTAVLAATLGVGFFAGRITESGLSTAQDAISVTVPAAAWETDGATLKGRVYEKTLGDSAVGTVGSTVGGTAPQVPKRVTSDVPPNQYLNRHLPARGGLDG